MSTAQDVDSYICINREKVVGLTTASSKRAVSQHVARTPEQRSREKGEKEGFCMCFFPFILNQRRVLAQSHVIGKDVDSLLIEFSNSGKLEVT